MINLYDETLKTISCDFGDGTIQNMKKTDDGYLFLVNGGNGTCYLKRGDKTSITEEIVLEKKDQGMYLFLQFSNIDSQSRIYGITNDDELFIWGNSIH